MSEPISRRRLGLGVDIEFEQVPLGGGRGVSTISTE